MKYKISNVANPDEFVKNNHIKIHPWIPNGKCCIKRAPVEDGFGEYMAFPVKVNTWEVIINHKAITFADIYIDTEQYEWDTNRILIVDDTIWLEAIEGGLKWFYIEEVKNDTNSKSS